MRLTLKKITHLVLLALITCSCAVKKYTLEPAFYSSGSDLGLILVKNDISTRRSGQSVLGAAVTNYTKYDGQLQAVDHKLDPERKFKTMYSNLFESKGKSFAVVDNQFDEEQFSEFEAPGGEKKYYKADIRSLKDKYDVDELMIVIIDYGLNQNYSGMFEAGKGGYSHVISNIVNLNDNSLIYKGETWGNGRLEKNWDTPPDYEPLRVSIDAAINQAVEIERTKY
ncbi:MAG: hypothetical protein RQ743_12610 [Bacteroidales bacterium]|nr:hypothetical protein [Bacteroidales bacterium]